jgi:putative membrane protein
MSGPGSEDPRRGGEGPYDGGEGTRRTRLANERTYLAWWRTGLAAFVVSVGAGRLVPAVAGGPQTLYSIVGILFALIGIVVIVYGRKRARDVDAAISAGRYHPADGRMLSVLAGLAAVGGLLLVALILVGR